MLSQRQFHIVLGCLETRCVNCEAQRFDSGVPAIVLKPELTFEKQVRPDSEFHTVRLHGDNTKGILLRIVRQPLAEAKPEAGMGKTCRPNRAANAMPMFLSGNGLFEAS